MLSNSPLALKLGMIQQLASECGAPVVAADVTSISDLQDLVDKTKEALGGGVDFVLHSVGMSPNIRKNREYGDLSYDWFSKTLDISALSFHKILQVLEKKDALNEGASVLALSYIAAQRTFGKYGDMAEAKAMLESIARSYGHRLGRLKKVRVNTISQSPTRTKAGAGIAGFDSFFDFASMMSPLGNSDAEACAQYCVVMFSDYTRMVTMQNLFHDGGFSFSGISEQVMEKMS